MWGSGISGIVFISLLMVLLQESSALRCWSCNSETPTEAFCGDPFDSSFIFRQNRRWSYVDCVLPPQSQYSTYNQYNQYSSYNPFGGGSSTGRLKPVCQKSKHRINDSVFVHRKCAWVNEYDPVDICMNERTPSYIQREFCEFCEYDGCNGAAQYGPIALLVALPVVSLKMLLL